MQYTTPLEKAFALAALGLAVFPVSNSKHPTIPGEGGFKHASTDPDRIREMWAAHPGPQVGYWTGASDVAVADVDTKPGKPNGFSGLWQFELDYHSEVHYVTPSGGSHYVFRDPDHLPPADNYGGLGGFDRKSGDSYCIWYGEVPAADQWQALKRVPGWLAQTKQERGDTYAAYAGGLNEWMEWLGSETPSRPVLDLIGRIEGTEHVGNEEIYRLLHEVHAMRTVLHEPGVRAAAEALWEQYNATSGHPADCEREWDYTVRRVIGKEWAPSPVSVLTMTEVAHRLSLPVPEPKPTPLPSTAASSWAEEDFEDVLDGSYAVLVPSAGWREDGHALFYPGCVNGLHGESESGKSWVAIYVAVQCVRRSEHVHYLDYESNRATVVRRMLLLGATPNQLRGYMHYRRPNTDPGAKDNPEFHDYLLLSESPATLIVFDGITEALSVSGYSATDNDDIPKWMKIPKYLAQETGAAVVMIDHVPKSNATARFAFGAQHKLAAVDGAQYAVDVEDVLAPGLVGALTLKVTKDRNGYVREHAGPAKGRLQTAALFRLDSTTPGRSVAALEAWDESKAVAKGAAEHGDRKANIMVLFARAGFYPSATQVGADFRREFGPISKANLTNALQELVDAGSLLADDSNARKGVVYTLPYSSSSELT